MSALNLSLRRGVCCGKLLLKRLEFLQLEARESCIEFFFGWLIFLLSRRGIGIVNRRVLPATHVRMICPCPSFHSVYEGAKILVEFQETEDVYLPVKKLSCRRDDFVIPRVWESFCDGIARRAAAAPGQLGGAGAVGGERMKTLLSWG